MYGIEVILEYLMLTMETVKLEMKKKTAYSKHFEQCSDEC